MCVQQVHLLLQAHDRIEHRALSGVRPGYAAAELSSGMQVNGEQTDRIPEADVGLGWLGGLCMRIRYC
jgi:hypothetical protein